MTVRLSSQKIYHSDSISHDSGFEFPLADQSNSAKGNVGIKINDIIYAKRRPLSVMGRTLRFLWPKA